MCRFLVYKGSDEILLSKLILEPTHSILKQSFDSRLRLDTRRGQNNADGFGIGFYTNPKLGAAPCLFTSTTPAWNSPNLNRLASKTASRLIFAHVRATTEGSLSEDNCHPFYHGSLMWMHNGGLGGWKYIKRRLGERLADRWYLGVVGGTDSEWAFALFLDTLERMGYNPSAQPEKGFGPTVLRRAMLKTIELINELIDDIPESIIQAEKVDTRSLLNFALTDGHSIICTRYVSSSTDEAASLYYSSGSQWENRPSHEDECNFQMERRDKGADVVLVASEPLTFERENWVNVPTNSILTIHGQTVMVHPIMDQFSNHSPYHTRSAAYVQTKGLSANEKLAMTPALEDAARAGSGGGGHRDAAVRRTASARRDLDAWRPWVAEHAKAVWNCAWFDREEDLERIDRLDFCRARMMGRRVVVEPTYLLYNDEDEEDVVAAQQRWAADLGVPSSPIEDDSELSPPDLTRTAAPQKASSPPGT
ncbi:hypothetical protein PspLS_05567 [Pyricularia sp. CBS 133598]|nr:hypothetical protein PspLS_05567 [Pyricularia sp. CBS 133598]